MLFVLKKECFVSNKFYFQQEVKNEFGASYYYFVINSKKIFYSIALVFHAVFPIDR
jgi:hypothetical protein